MYVRGSSPIVRWIECAHCLLFGRTDPKEVEVRTLIGQYMAVATSILLQSTDHRTETEIVKILKESQSDNALLYHLFARPPEGSSDQKISDELRRQCEDFQLDVVTRMKNPKELSRLFE